ncbi:PLP-dependent aminotransferase family protein [Rhodoferax fermentans]|uniref:GntR family transcriptional regulator n=1 Tax=Rhodoferax fermentans TaxID=28066 RepID=A0A1T1ANA8_RHOFE|nr:PLP-dependent aminotransferase family protein [Rhodoferax fermentans]MBK1683987.1 PLP-dependent aminotransferase family protein [Rhodoferax fermentans]OOV05408.1 GntR family transcriptional regulator [Rhodoferax fermentans]
MLSEFLLSELSRLNPQDRLPLHRQLYEALRRAILENKLSPEERLPSSRDLVQDLGLSRNTVVAALTQLTVEGYLVSRVGSGTFVSAKVPQRQRRPLRQTSHPAQQLSHRGQALGKHFCASELEIQPFTPGIADFSAFPVALWQRLQNKHWRMTYPDMLDYSSSGGYAPLRRAVADYLHMFRSVALDLDQVIITSGTQESLELCAQLLADQGDTVWLEDPAYWGAGKAFMATGLKIHPVPVDEQGIAPLANDRHAPPRLMYVTPSHQYPTGAVMSLERRHQILSLANEHQAWVLEDDYDSEFRFSGPPIASLAGLDTQGRVLYLGSFSKVLYPGLKLAYVVVPKGLAAAFKAAHYDLNRPGQMPVQAALAEFIDMGHFAACLRKARQSYAQRRHCLLEALQPCLGTRARITGAEQGLHLCVRLPDHLDDQALARQLGKLGLVVRPLSAYCLKRRDLRGLVIGYGYAPLAQIQRFGPVLAQVVQQALAHRAPA